MWGRRVQGQSFDLGTIAIQSDNAEIQRFLGRPPISPKPQARRGAFFLLGLPADVHCFHMVYKNEKG